MVNCFGILAALFLCSENNDCTIGPFEPIDIGLPEIQIETEHYQEKEAEKDKSDLGNMS